MLWQISHRASRRGVKIADRHYSRQKPGTPQFVKPGRCVVLLTPGASSLWVTSWPYPELVKHAWPGAWECSLFRHESGDDLASDLIRQAVSATRAVLGAPPPEGFVSFIDPTKVRPVVVRGLPTFGYSWVKAGWRYAGTTAAGLLAFTLAADRMPPPEPPLGWTPQMFIQAEESAS